MFGVDRADQMRMQYSTCRKAVKWWKYVFWFLFDVCVCNAFVCMRESPNHKLTTRMGKLKPRTQIDFWIKLSEQVIGSFRATSASHYQHLTLLALHTGQWKSVKVKVSKRGCCKHCYDQNHRHEVTMKCEQCQIYLSLTMTVSRNIILNYCQQLSRLYLTFKACDTLGELILHINMLVYYTVCAWTFLSWLSCSDQNRASSSLVDQF